MEILSFFFFKEVSSVFEKNHAETPILKDFFFHFCSKWSPFSKMLIFNGDINFFLKKYLLFLKSVNFWGVVFF